MVWAEWYYAGRMMPGEQEVVSIGTRGSSGGGPRGHAVVGAVSHFLCHTRARECIIHKECKNLVGSGNDANPWEK